MTKTAPLLFLAVLAAAAPAIAMPDGLAGGWRLAQADSDAGGGPNSLGEGYGPQQDQARKGVREGGLKPLSSIIAEIQRRNPGRQLDTGLEDRNGRPSYRVRWVDRSGKRMDFIVDARTGAVLSVEGR